MLGEYYHGVSRVGAGIAASGEYVALGESLESFR